MEMSFFKALGKYIEYSGGPSMLTETNVLAPGSLNGFLTGKVFNRCKRLHPLLALAFEMLHFLKFLEAYTNRDELSDLFGHFHDYADWNQFTSMGVFKDCIEKYSEFTEETKSGKHGATAQYWMMYVEYVHAYHTLERAVRTNNIDLYTRALTPVIGLFFMVGHINYARWMSKFQLDLLNIDQSHPGIRHLLEDGAFSVRSTDKSFSRIPVDLTLEQTINADAASRLTGISAMTNNYEARLRWMVTKSARAGCMSKLQEILEMKQLDDVTADLRKSKIKRDTDDLKKIVGKIKECCNPFESANENLHNIFTGKQASVATKTSLLNVSEDGEKRRKAFVKECKEDPSRFEKTIKREKLTSFKNECVKSSTSTNKKNG